jgi:hypothetical protein
MPAQAVATCEALIALMAAKRLQLGVHKRVCNELLRNFECCIAAQAWKPAADMSVGALERTTTQVTHPWYEFCGEGKSDASWRDQQKTET